jgi:hypothetical protein
MMKRVYLECWNRWEDIRKDYSKSPWDNQICKDVPEQEPACVFACYAQPSYEGYASVVYTNDGIVFYVTEGSHCSCYGLEGQWDPTEHSLEELTKMDLYASYDDRGQLNKEFKTWLEQFEDDGSKLGDWA